MKSSPLLLAALLAACLAHGAESVAPRRSLTFDLIPTDSSDESKCWESKLALDQCRPEILASLFEGCPVTPACCHAADEVYHHCDPLARALLPPGLLDRCALQATAGAPAVRPRPRRAAPPSAPTIVTPGPRATGGGGAPAPGPDGYTSVAGFPSPPPRPPFGVSGGTVAPPGPDANTIAGRPLSPRGAPEAYGGTPAPPPGEETSVKLPPPQAASGRRAPMGGYGGVSPPPTEETSVKLPPPPSPRVASGPRASAVSAGSRGAAAPAAPAYEDEPTPKVIARGGAGGRTRRAPGVRNGAATGAPMIAASAPQTGSVQAPSPSPQSLSYGTPV